MIEVAVGVGIAALVAAIGLSVMVIRWAHNRVRATEQAAADWQDTFGGIPVVRSPHVPEGTVYLWRESDTLHWDILSMHPSDVEWMQETFS